MALNDTLDLRRDRALHPDRPLPSGRLTVDTAIGLITLTLLVAILGASTLGLPAVWMALGTAAAVLIYNASVKYLPSVGLVLVALIYAAHMMAANIELVFVWPVWLAMSHMLAVGALSHLLAKRRPALTRAGIASAIAGWLVWSVVLLWVGYHRAGTLWPSWVNVSTLVAPAALCISFLVFAWMRFRRSGATQRSAEKIERYGALWLALYTIAWMAGQGKWTEAGILAGLAVVGFLGMTVLKELYNLAEHPVAFRR
jgi:4-hydroxybenzoate polyprenyltransferase